MVREILFWESHLAMIISAQTWTHRLLFCGAVGSGAEPWSEKSYLGITSCDDHLFSDLNTWYTSSSFLRCWWPRRGSIAAMSSRSLVFLLLYSLSLCVIVFVYSKCCQVARLETDFYICVFQTLHPALEPFEDRKAEIQSRSPVSCAKGLPHSTMCSLSVR